MKHIITEGSCYCFGCESWFDPNDLTGMGACPICGDTNWKEDMR